MLENIKASIERLIAAYERLKVENDALRENIGQIRLQNEDYRKQITELEKQIDNLKLSGAILGGDPARSGKGKESIDRLIREIDRCISLMEG